MKSTRIITILQQIYFKPCLLKDTYKPMNVIHDLMICSRVIRRTRTANLHSVLVGDIRKICVWYRAA